MKFNTETYYESTLLFNRLKKLPRVKETILSNNKLILVSKGNNKVIKVVQILNVEILEINNLTFVRLNDINGLLDLSRKTRGDKDDMYLIGEDDEDEEE